MSAESDFLPSILAFMHDDPMIATYHVGIDGNNYDPTTGELTGTTTDVSVKGIILDIDRLYNGTSTKFGKEILSGDKEFYMYPVEKADPLATPIVPDPSKDTITVAGKKYKICVSKSIDPTGSNPLVYNFLLRI